jgi:hypothetical protein
MRLVLRISARAGGRSDKPHGCWSGLTRIDDYGSLCQWTGAGGRKERSTVGRSPDERELSAIPERVAAVAAVGRISRRKQERWRARSRFWRFVAGGRPLHNALEDVVNNPSANMLPLSWVRRKSSESLACETELPPATSGNRRDTNQRIDHRIGPGELPNRAYIHYE